MFLTQQEIEQLTGRKRPSHQVRVLKKQGIPFQLRPKGRKIFFAKFFGLSARQPFGK